MLPTSTILVEIAREFVRTVRIREEVTSGHYGDQDEYLYLMDVAKAAEERLEQLTQAFEAMAGTVDLEDHLTETEFKVLYENML